MKSIISLLIAAFVLTSCSSAKRAQRNKVATPAPVTDTAPQAAAPVNNGVSAKEVLAKVKHIDFETFNGKMDVDFNQQGGKQLNFDVKLQMYKDSLIWLSGIGPLGIELVRGIVTKDSVHIINKWDKNYISTSHAFLLEKLGMPLDLTTLQDLLIGNAVFVNPENATFTADGAGIKSIRSTGNGLENIINILLPDYTIQSSRFQEIADSSRNAELLYADYETKDNRNFATRRLIDVKYKGNIVIKLKYKNYAFNQELSTPFSIPKNYTKKL